jgi:hypothetical protein
MRKYLKCYKQERIYNAEVLSEAVEKHFYRMHKKYKEKLKTQYKFLSKNVQVLRYNMRHYVLRW